jgi:tetratricopeptide (TPR) repeat protein
MPKINRIRVLAAALAMAAFGAVAMSQATSSDHKPIIDGTGIFGKTLVGKLANDVEGRQRKNVHPFVIGYCGWRVRALTNFSLTKLDGMQIGLCKTILDFFDPEITPTLAAIERNATSMIKPIEISPAESKAIQDFVVMKYGTYYMGLFDPKHKPDPVAKWKYNVGGNLGELAAYMTIWWRIWTNEKYEAKIASYLAGLDDDIKSVPKGVDPSFVANLRKLNSLGSKTKFTPVERRQLNDLLTETLLSSISLTNIANVNEPIPSGSGSASFGPAPTPNSNTTPVPTTAGGKTATEYLEAGKSFYAKGDYKPAIEEFDQAAKLEPMNGLILFHRALARAKLGLVDDAIKDYNAVIFLRVSLREAYFNRGTLYLNKKEFKSAIADLNAAIKLDPRYEDAIYNRGLAYYNSNDLFAALGDFNTVLKAKPTHINALIMRSYVYCAQGLGMSAFKDQELATQLGGKFERGCK